MPDVLLCTMNARYYHSAFGLRYLLANMGELASNTRIVEYTIQQSASVITEDLLSQQPKVIGIGVYIWNAALTVEVVQNLKKIAPEVHIVLGGPEVSHELEDQLLCALADVVITGEADHAFREVCADLLSGMDVPHIVRADLPEMTTLRTPYHLYTAEDIANRIVYVEASRGCPFRCQFCLSSLNVPVRKPELDSFLGEMETLFTRGVRHFKFVDRTFNLSANVSGAILDFFLERIEPGLFLHFEMIPDKLPTALKARIKAFPPGSLQFEVGIQTWNDDVASRINRRLNREKTSQNLDFLRKETQVHIHADLIAGLPGEDLESFASGFDAVYRLNPQEIQVGILKRLRGAPIAMHTAQYGMCYSEMAPYEVMHTDHMTQIELDFVKQYASLWDRIANSGYFICTLPVLTDADSPFAAFSNWTRWFFERNHVSYGHSLKKLEDELFLYLTEECGHTEAGIADHLIKDRMRLSRSIPRWLKRLAPLEHPYQHAQKKLHNIPKRQARHLGII